MDSNKSVFSLFGGVFETLQNECIPTPVHGELYDKACKMVLDIIRVATIKQKYRRNILWHKELVDFINSPIVDKLYEDRITDPKIVCIKNGYLELLEMFLSRMSPFLVNKFFSTSTETLATALEYGHLELAERIYSSQTERKGYSRSDKYWSEVFTTVWRNGRVRCAKWIAEKFPNITFSPQKFCATKNTGEEIPYGWLLTRFPVTCTWTPYPQSVCGETELGYLKWWESTNHKLPMTSEMFIDSVVNRNEDVQDYISSCMEWNLVLPKIVLVLRNVMISTWVNQEPFTTIRRRIDKIFSIYRRDNLAPEELVDLLVSCFLQNNMVFFDFLIRRFKFSLETYIPNTLKRLSNGSFIEQSHIYEDIGEHLADHIRDNYEVSETLVRTLVEEYKSGWVYSVPFDIIICQLTPRKYQHLVSNVVEGAIDRYIAIIQARMWSSPYSESKLLYLLDTYEEIISPDSFKNSVDIFFKKIQLTPNSCRYQEVLQRIHLRLL